MQHLEVSCAVQRFFKSLSFKGLMIKLSFILRMADTYIVCHIAAFHGNIKIKLLLKTKPCNLVDVYRRFGIIFYCYLQTVE